MIRQSMIVAALCTAGPVTARPPAVPVIVGGEAELDACTSIGRVEGLNARRDGYLSVRVSPTVRARAIDRLRNGQQLWVCQQRSGWYGVVYTGPALSRGKDGLPPDCGVSGPIAKATAYRGPCKAGWVSASYVRMIAG